MKIDETILNQIPLDVIENYIKIKELKHEVVKAQKYEKATELREMKKAIYVQYPKLYVGWERVSDLKDYCIKCRRDEKINTIIDEN